MAFLETVRDQLKPDDTKAREQLDFLRKAAEGQLERFRLAFTERIRNPDAFKEEILPVKMFEHIDQYRIDITEGSSSEIDNIVDTFLGGGEDAVKSGFKEMAKFAFKALLGSTQIGESRVSQWFVTMEFGALIRVDLMAWKYNFSGEGVIATAKNAYCFTLTKSFADTEKLKLPMIGYFVAKSLGVKSIDEIMSNPTLKSYVEYLKDNLSTKERTNSVMIDEYRALRRAAAPVLRNRGSVLSLSLD